MCTDLASLQPFTMPTEAIHLHPFPVHNSGEYCVIHTPRPYFLAEPLFPTVPHTLTLSLHTPQPSTAIARTQCRTLSSSRKRLPYCLTRSCPLPLCQVFGTPRLNPSLFYSNETVQTHIKAHCTHRGCMIETWRRRLTHCLYKGRKARRRRPTPNGKRK